MPEFHHTPVLLKETLELLNLRPGDNVVDGTVGLGGHATVILESTSPNGRLLALDRDPRQIVLAKERLAKFGNRVVLIHDSFSNLAKHVYDQRFTSVAAVLLDLGFSSVHVDDATRGFSFQSEGPLDMRYDPSNSGLRFLRPPRVESRGGGGEGGGGDLTAAEIVNTWSEEELARIFLVYGDEKNFKKLARAIVKARQEKLFVTTTDLAQLIETVTPRRGKVHPATKVFQALRIVTNDELGELERVLPEAINVLKPGGRLVIITFHSLEDRIVKSFFRKQENKTLKIINKHVIVPSEEEVKANPRSRSAKLRGAERL